MNKARMKKIGAIALNVLLCIFLVFSILSVILTLFSKKDPDGAARIFGYQMRIVTSDSMNESEYTDVSEWDIGSIPVRSVVFIKQVPSDPDAAYKWYDALDEGDVLTFRYVYSRQLTITHRITKIYENERGGFTIELTGDNKASETGQLTQVIDTSVPNSTNYVIGKVVGQSYPLGLLMSFLKSDVGIIFAIILPCLLIIAFEATKLVRFYTGERARREKEALGKKDAELEELRRKIAELEGDATNKKDTAPEEKTTDPKE